MKRFIALFLVLITVLAAVSCAKEESDTTQPSAGTRAVTCAISYPTLLEDGGIQMSSCMEDYPVGTMEQALRGGLNGKTEVSFDEEGDIYSIGGLEAKNGCRFVIVTIASNGQATVIDKKPADITLEDFVSYEIYYAGENGEQITNIE